jgi:two-component system response regulator YesN
MLRSMISYKPVFVQMVLSYMLLGALLISVFAILLTNRVTDDMVSEIQEHTEQRVYQSYNTADILLKSTYDYFYQLFERDSLLFQGLYGRNLSRIEVGEINNRLSSILTTNTLVHSIYLYNFQDNLVFSTLSTSMTIAEFYDSAMTDMLAQGGAEIIFNKFIPRSESFTHFNNNYDRNLISILFADTAQNSHTHGIMVVNLDQRVFQELVSASSAETATKSMIIDHSGTILSHPDGMMINTNVAQEPYIQRVLRSKAVKGEFLAQAGDGKSYISYIKSNRFGISFVGVSDYEKLVGKANVLKRFIYVIAVIFIVLSVIAGGFFSKRLYKPIQMLLDKVGKSPQHASGTRRSEYDLLSHSFDDMTNTISNLQSALRKHMPESKKSLLTALLNGDMRDVGSLIQRLEQTDTLLKHSHLQVGVVRIDGYSRLIKQYGTWDTSLFKYAAMNIAGEIVGTEGQVEVLEDAEDSFTMIWNLVHDDHVQSKIDMLHEVSQAIGQFLKLSVTIGVGEVAESLDKLNHSWKTASQAARYRLIYGQGQILRYDRIETSWNETYEYPLHLEKSVTDYLKAGDLNKLNQAFQAFLAHIRVLRFDETVLSLNQLMVMTLRVAIEMVDDSSYEWMLELQDIHNQLRAHDTLEEIGEWYGELCRRIVEIRNHNAAGKNKEQVQGMLQLIEKHFSDPSLSVDVLAKQVGFSTNHARKVFKDYTGQSLSAYLNEYRYEKAKELLLGSELPANRIGEMVGISNPSYFYAAFKKFAGKTPDHYRKAERIKAE